MVAIKRSKFDPTTLNDPVAIKTQWTPANAGGASVRTRELSLIDGDRVEFKTTGIIKLSCLLFVVGAPLGYLFFPIDGSAAVALFVTCVVTAGGAVAFYWVTTPVVFDTSTGWFWRGRTAPEKYMSRTSAGHHARLDDVHALQLISEFVSGDEQNFRSYELNLVLKGGQRINVVDHGDLIKLREDAAALGEFLGKPVWDAT